MKIKNSKGFTLVEVLVALTVLGILIMPVTGMFSSSARNNYKTYRNSVALTVARDIMDRIKAGDIDHSNLEEEINSYKNKYKVEIRVDVSEGSGGNSLEKVKVYVAPGEGMDARAEGIMIASYATNVFIDSIDTSPPEGGNNGGGDGHGGDDGDDGEGNLPPPPETGDEEDYWNWYESLWDTFRIVGIAIIALLIVPAVLCLKVENMDIIQAITGCYNILVEIHDTHGHISWGLFKDKVKEYYGVDL